MKSKYKAIIFDLDGTLLDTSEDLTNAVNFVLKKYNMTQRTKSEVTAFTGNGIYELVKKSIGYSIDNNKFDLMMNDFKEYYSLHGTDNTKPYDKIYELLGELNKSGYKLAVVSNKIDSATKTLCNRFFEKYINIAIGDTVGITKKPQTGTLNLALNKLCVTNDECVYIGDSEVDVLTAKNASMKLIAVSWGFRSREILESLNAENIADTPFDIIKILNKI